MEFELDQIIQFITGSTVIKIVLSLILLENVFIFSRLISDFLNRMEAESLEEERRQRHAIINKCVEEYKNRSHKP